MSMIPYCRHSRSYHRRRNATLSDPLESSRRYIMRRLWLGGVAQSLDDRLLGLIKKVSA
jgi:hypothetical protein